ncbi:MAG: aminotransferase class V-fold PLP-dependent enzyme [Bacteroidales bacterium]|nr:aminotransferase class V-fold PLP-dependent enzyme [Bacteroidales bacterium]
MKTNKPKTTLIPVYRNTAFHLVDIPTMKKAFSDEVEYKRDPELYIYSRYRNPNVAQAETMLMGIEDCKWSILTQSGLSAIDTALSIFQEKGSSENWLFFSEIYGGTNQYIDSVLVNRRGLNIHRFLPDGDAYSIEKFEQLLKSTKPKVVFFEAISNPMLIALDANDFIKKAKQYGAYVIVDNTFATPYLWKPLQNGADIVIHSVTKYLAGHGTISAGVLSGNDKSIEKSALEYRKLVGHMLSPDDAARLCEQLKTYELRVEKQFKNAFVLAYFLNGHHKVERVLYPGIESHPTHFNAFKLFNGKGYGAIITFDLAGSSFEDKQRKCSKFIELLIHEIPLIPTLGDTETTLMPIEPVWGDKFPYPGMIRLSVGVENVNKLTDIIIKAFDNLD